MSASFPPAPSRRLARLLLLAASLAVAGLTLVTFVLRTESSAGGDAPAGDYLQPVLSVASSYASEVRNESAWLLGAAPGGEPGEAWAFRNLEGTAAPPSGGTQRLEFSQTSAAGMPQSVFMRHTDATGWSLYETPLAADDSVAGLIEPVRNSAQITPAGGGALVAKMAGAAVLFVRDPGAGGRFRELPPDDGVLLDADVDGPAESFSTADFSRAPLAAFEGNEQTAVLATATGRGAETVVSYADGVWARDTVEYPAGAEDDFAVVALAATDWDNAWMLARSDGYGLMLFQRAGAAGTGVWQPRPLGRGEFETESTAGLGLSEVGATFGPAGNGVDPLTVTEDAVWLDGVYTIGGDRRSFTLFYEIDAGAVTHSWCDDGSPLCDSSLDFDFSAGSSAYGYRSQAWAGAGFGTRIISNPRLVDGSDSTNRGTYLRLDQDRFVRMPGAGFENRVSLAMSSVGSGWNGTNVRIGAPAFSPPLTQWSIGVRTPLVDVAPEPGVATAALGSGALAVGEAGAVARYKPGEGWDTEFLQSSNGFVQRPNLRGVAWPQQGRAHAVGDGGAMWLWRRESGLWERDPGTPIGLVANLMAIAFDPSNPVRGYAVGREGTILEYDKRWQRVCPENEQAADCGDHRMPSGLADADIRQVAFSAGQALAITGRKVLVSEGGDWRIDADAQALLDELYEGSSTNRTLLTVSGLPDGGAFVAGSDGIAIERDSANGPWRYPGQPIADGSVVESALFREGSALRALVSIVPTKSYPPQQIDPEVVPGTPLPLLPPLTMPSDGYLLRETDHGWDDEQRSSFHGPLTLSDKPLKPDPILGLLAGSDGTAWAVGGWTGNSDVGNRGSASSGQRTVVKTAAVMRYRRGTAESASGNAVPTQIAQSQKGVNFVVGGHATCEDGDCSEAAATALGPDRQLLSSVASTLQLSQQPNGARFFAYTGGRAQGGAGAGARELSRLAALLGSQPGLPVFAAVSRGEDSSVFASEFSQFPAPLGSAPADSGITARSGFSGARKYYAFESRAVSGAVRVVVIDNASGALDAAQQEWLRNELRAAKSDAVPAVVIGSRDLNHRFSPALGNRADDALAVARLLRDEGASAYFFERPEENRAFRIPVGDADTIPAFGTGTLGYRSEVVDPGNSDKASSLFGDTGTLLANIDVESRDPTNNRAPVSVRVIPLVENLSLEAVDGTLLRRSRPALFAGLGRRPIAGDRWRQEGGSASPAGSDPYTRLPVDLCRIASCDTRIEPEFEFRSSDPDIADFVRVDPASSNTRKPLLENGKTISDSRSGLLCAFNEGTATVTVIAGGLSFSRRVTVLAGSVMPPCGTRPLAERRFKRDPVETPGGPPPPPPGAAPPVALALALPPPPVPRAKASPLPRVQRFDPFLAKLEPLTALAAIAPPPPPSLARPIPPTGGMARVYEEKREEEVATEDSQAFARYEHTATAPATWSIAGIVLMAALFGVSLPRRRSGADSGAAVAWATVSTNQPKHGRRR